MINKSQIILHDIRHTVYHELGHHSMALHLDVSASVSDFTLNINRDDYREKTMVLGSVKIFGNPGTDKMKLIGLAGEVTGSMLAHLDCEDESDFEYIDEREIMDKIEWMIFDNTISETDSTLIKGFTLDDITLVVNVLKREWDNITEYAEEIISDLRKEAGV